MTVYRCKDCPETSQGFLTQQALHQHRFTVHNTVMPPLTNQDSTGLWQCPHCPRKFLSQSGLAQHFKLIHLNPTPTGNKKRKAKRQLKFLIQPIGPKMVRFAHKHNLICMWCSREVKLDVSAGNPLAPTKEHIIPRTKGGTNKQANLGLAHKVCNEYRSAKDANTFRQTKKMNYLLAEVHRLFTEYEEWQKANEDRTATTSSESPPEPS